jgi:hypothetical protein
MDLREQVIELGRPYGWSETGPTLADGDLAVLMQRYTAEGRYRRLYVYQDEQGGIDQVVATCLGEKDKHIAPHISLIEKHLKEYGA